MPNEPHYLDGLKKAKERIKEEERLAKELEAKVRAEMLLFKPKRTDPQLEIPLDDVRRWGQHWSG